MTTNQERVNAAIALLREGLAPFVVREVPPDRLRRLVNDPKLEQTPIDSWDVLALLKVMEATWREVFGKTLGRIERSCVSELREWRNRWAHQVEFSTADAERTLDSAERLLKSIQAPQADEVGRIRRELRSGHIASKSPSSRVGTAAGAKVAQDDGLGSPHSTRRAVGPDDHAALLTMRHQGKPPVMAGKYARLCEYLHALEIDEWRASFAEVEDIVGVDLPASARRHAAWWSNGGHSHARAWMDAGFETCGLSISGRTVVFRRTGASSDAT